LLKTTNQWEAASADLSLLVVLVVRFSS